MFVASEVGFGLEFDVCCGAWYPEVFKRSAEGDCEIGSWLFFVLACKLVYDSRIVSERGFFICSELVVAQDGLRGCQVTAVVD